MLTSFGALGLGSERNAPRNGEPPGGFLLHGNAPAYRSALVKDFLAKNNVTTLEQPLLLSPADFYLFARLKSALKGQRFCDATDIIKNATEELNRLSQNGFQECFQLFLRFLPDAQRGYFEGNVA